MKTFLKKYLTEEQLAELTAKYVAANPGATELPVYISKQRLDEVLAQKKTADEASIAVTKELEEFKKNQQGTIDAAVKMAVDAANAEHTKVIDAMKLDAEATEKIYKAKGRSVKAIKALIDPSKKLDDELARLQKEEAYLFGDGDIPGGTGKQGKKETPKEEKELEAMRKAVGIPTKDA